MKHWLEKRGVGALLHPTSLPGKYGIGNVGQGARQWIDFLSQSNMAYWQICPLGPTGYGDSPYQCYSAFAGNPYLIDWDELVEDGLLTCEELHPLTSLSAERCEYQKILAAYEELHAKLVSRWASFSPPAEFTTFSKKEESWLRPYAYFRALKNVYDGKCWVEWPSKYRNFQKLDWDGLPKKVLTLAEVEAYLQFVFFKQWYALKEYANAAGVEIIGDLPIYVAYDSADVWANRDLFILDKAGRKTHQAGVPPDYFSETGQLWGNPLYRWDVMEKNKFAWWTDRIEQNLEMYDAVRIDHFRAFEAYWSVKESEETAQGGKWITGPGLPFFEIVRQRFPEGKIIAEDLGVITDKVHALREATGYPGMAVLHFGFGGDTTSEHLPHSVEKNRVFYAGTHDNDTSVGWYNSLPDFSQDLVRRYLAVSGNEISWDMIRALYRSHANLVVVTAQDLLSLGAEARFNYPGRALGNWGWRATKGQIDSLFSSCAYLRELAHLYARTEKEV